ncbi:hypothetical protein [Ramlibacter sp.]|uniref:hypothetical protein n=1 Tax=Ramlibacter sp. TaxID=1917967 RepID=UPI003D14CEBB
MESVSAPRFQPVSGHAAPRHPLAPRGLRVDDASKYSVFSGAERRRRLDALLAVLHHHGPEKCPAIRVQCGQGKYRGWVSGRLVHADEAEIVVSFRLADPGVLQALGKHAALDGAAEVRFAFERHSQTYHFIASDMDEDKTRLLHAMEVTLRDEAPVWDSANLQKTPDRTRPGLATRIFALLRA